MAAENSVTHWLQQLQAGDRNAAQKLWENYFRRLVGLARTRLQGLRRRVVADEEDVALSAFDSFCRGAERGRYPELRDRQNLWRLLVSITARKASHLVRDQQRQKRGDGAVRGESALINPNEPGAAGLEEVIGREPTPAFAAQVAEEYERLLAMLSDAELRSIAIWKMEGDTTEDISARLKCAPSTVARRLSLIRQIWEKELSQ